MEDNPRTKKGSERKTAKLLFTGTRLRDEKKMGLKNVVLGPILCKKKIAASQQYMKKVHRWLRTL